ncbi:MAG: internalization-related competence protein ComEC/Rec2, partial [Paenibacillus sp.]|nr:internalization-related competence protein ComEC/Rec2 [Paenibacillus sp.]
FSKLGLTHILAISGLHVAVFVAGCLFLLRVLGFTKEKALIITLAFVPIYTAIAGGSPSVVRAGLMAMIALYAARRGILKDGLHILSAVALMMLVWEPYYLFDVSFQLSFIVTVGLIVGVPRFSKLLPIRSPMLNSAIAVTTVAQMISFPISIYYFNSFSLLSWFANLLLVPFISFLTLPLGSVALMLSFVWLRAGDWVAWLADWCNRLTFWSVQEGAAYRAAQQIWPTPSLVWISLYFVLLYLMYRAFCFWKANGRLGRAVAASCAMLALLAYGYTPAVLGRSGEVSFLDVGQGDSILIRSPQGRIMLIDGGGTLSFRKPGEEWKERQNPYEVGEKLLVPLLKKRGIHRIDYLVISHQDADHIGGLQAVVEQIPVKAVLFNDSWKGNESSQKLFETALQHGAQLLGGGAGAKVTLDKFTKLTVIGPDPEDNNSLGIVDDQNGESLVMWMSMFDSQFLFTGDIGLKQEASLLQSLASKQSLWLESGNLATTARTLDVLKIAHHGSKSSTTAEWLQFWKPHQAVISVGASNSYGHPNPQVIERIQSIQADIHRTDRDGEVVYHVTRNGLKVQQKLFGL